MKYNGKKKYQIAMRRFYSNNSGNKKNSHLFGIDKIGFVNHINHFLLNDMSNENFGKLWSLDHIVPVHLFDLNDINELKLCYNFINIMPMFSNDNRLKGASVQFSIEKLKLLKIYFNGDEKNVEICDNLIKKCEEEITKTYTRYLEPLLHIKPPSKW